MDLAVRIYEVTGSFPAQERYGLAQQMRRAAVSIPSNMAEGYGRRTAKQRYHFLETALGSVFELETQTELAARLAFVGEPQFRELADTIRTIGRSLTALMRYVERETEEPRGTRGTPRNPEAPRGTRGTK